MSLDVSLIHPDTHKEVWSRNITHNLNQMAEAAGVYEAMWRPEEINATVAANVIGPLTAGLEKLVADPDYYRQYNAPNGWGKYESLLRFVREYLDACQAYPDARISVCR